MQCEKWKYDYNLCYHKRRLQFLIPELPTKRSHQYYRTVILENDSGKISRQYLPLLFINLSKSKSNLLTSYSTRKAYNKRITENWNTFVSSSFTHSFSLQYFIQNWQKFFVFVNGFVNLIVHLMYLSNISIYSTSSESKSYGNYDQ